MASAGRAPAQRADDLVTARRSALRPVIDDRCDTLAHACPSDIVDTSATPETANVVRLAQGGRLPS